MTNEEAIRNVDCTRSYLSISGVVDEPVYKALEMANKALEKQIPVKRIRKHGGYFREYLISYCRACGNEISNSQYQYHFCPDCGQAIDWSDEDDCE